MALAHVASAALPSIAALAGVLAWSPSEGARNVRLEARSDAPTVLQEQGSYIFQFAQGDDAPTVLELTEAFAELTGALYVWDDATHAKLGQQKIQLLGQKVVAKDRVDAFVTALLLVSGFTATPIDDELGFVAIEAVPLPGDESPTVEEKAPVARSAEGDQILFGSSGSADPMSVLQLLQAAQEIAGANFTWSEGVDRAVRATKLHFEGRAALPPERFLDLTEAILGTFGFEYETVGDGDVSVIVVRQTR